MIVGIEIPSSILTVIPLLFINQCIIVIPVKYYLKPLVLKYRPSLRGRCVKNENLLFHKMA